MASPKKSTSTLINYLKIYSIVGYYLLIIPYKIVPSSRVILPMQAVNSIGFRFHTNLFQKVLCTIAYMSVFYHQLFMLTNPQFQSNLFIPSFPNEGILSVVVIISRFVGFGYLFCAAAVFWCKKEHFLLIFKTVQSLPYGTTSHHTRTLIWIYCGFVLGYLWYILGLYGDFFDDFNAKLDFSNSENLTVALNSLHSKAQLILAFNKSPETVTFETIGFGEALIALIYFTLYVVTGLFQIHVELIVVVGIIYVWHATTLFEQWYLQLDSVDDSKPEIIVQALQQYDQLKTLVNETNKLLGMPILLVIAFVLPFYATFAGFAMSSNIIEAVPSPPGFILALHYAIYFCEILIAAEVNRKGNEFVRWVSSPQFIDSLSTRQLTSLSIDVNSDQLALKGCGFFSLTYRFLTSVLGIFITYSVLVMQFKKI